MAFLRNTRTAQSSRARPTLFATLLCIALSNPFSLFCAAAEPQLALIPEYSAITPGEPFDIAVVLRPAPGWHTYWLNPGDSGMAPQLAWQLPPLTSLNKIAFPIPALFEEEGMTTIGYSGETALIANFAAATSIEPGATITITLNLSWLECRDICRAVESTAALKLNVGAETVSGAKPEPRFAGWRGRLPRNGSGHWQAHASVHADGVTLRLSPVTTEARRANLKHASFLPLANGLLDLDKHQAWRRDESAWEILLPKGMQPIKPGADFSGLLLLPAQKEDAPHSGWNLQIRLTETTATGTHGHDPATATP